MGEIMIRNIFAIIAGVFAGVVLIGMLEMAGHSVFPPPEGVDVKDPEALKTLMKDIPFMAKFIVTLAWGIGSFVAAIIAIKIAQDKAWPGWVAVGLLWLAGIFTLFQLPHPWWMVATGVAFPLAAGYAATRLFAKR